MRGLKSKAEGELGSPGFLAPIGVSFLDHMASPKAKGAIEGELWKVTRENVVHEYPFVGCGMLVEARASRWHGHAELRRFGSSHFKIRNEPDSQRGAAPRFGSTKRQVERAAAEKRFLQQHAASRLALVLERQGKPLASAGGLSPDRGSTRPYMELPPYKHIPNHTCHKDSRSGP